MKAIDLIIHNAQIYTLDPSRPQAEAVAVRDGKILAVGSLAEIMALDGAKTADSFDLKGGTLVPGLNDAHTHLAQWSMSLQEVDLVGVRSLEAALELVRQRAAVMPPGSWILGAGWDQNYWGGLPDRQALDRVAPGHPVALDSKDHHLVWANSRAIELAKVTAQTADPAGGEIVRDEQGEPSGVFKETAVGLIMRHVAKPAPAEWDAIMEQALPVAHRAGLTAVHTIEPAAGFAVLQRLHQRGKLTLRANVLLMNPVIGELAEVGIQQNFGDAVLKLGQIKFFLDGTLGSQTAALFEPYNDDLEGRPNNTGLLRMEREDFLRQVQAAVAAGFGIAVHVIGDRAAWLGLEAIAEARRADPTGNLRHRLEHVQLLRRQDLSRFTELGVIASVQPTHATTDRDHADRYWGEERLTRSGYGYAYKSLLQSGARVALGSDAPVERIDPLKGIYAAVARKREGEDRPAWLPQERLSVEEALRGFTEGPAFAAHDEQRRGQIVPGFLADFTALGQDLFAIAEDDLPKIPVVATFVGGQPVWSEL